MQCVLAGAAQHPLRSIAWAPNKAATLSPLLCGQHRRYGHSIGREAIAASRRFDTVNEQSSVDLVDSLRQASGYIQGHRNSRMVVVLPDEIVSDDQILTSVTNDLLLLLGQGIQLVLAVGTLVSSANNSIRENASLQPDDTLFRAHAATLAVQSKLSQGPDVRMTRRHTRTFASIHSKPSAHIVAGNWVHAKAQGVVNGKDQGCKGQVRYVETEAIDFQLGAGNVVLLSSIGFTTSGHAAHCDIYSVATEAAAAMKADKLICLTKPGMLPFQLPSWLSDRHLRSLLNTMASAHACLQGWDTSSQSEGIGDLKAKLWQKCGLPNPLIAAATACAQGVKRAHLVDATQDGALLLEMYSDNGAGTMISIDVHEGMRAATDADMEAIQGLMKPLEMEGILVPRTREQLAADLPYFYCVDSRDAKGQVVACAMVKPLDGQADGHVVGELGAFCTHPCCRGSGIGDSLLEWLGYINHTPHRGWVWFTELEAKAIGLTRIVLLTTRTGDWFQERGYHCAGPAHTSPLLPAQRRAKVNAARNALLYTKDLPSSDDSQDATGNHAVLPTSTGPAAGMTDPVMAISNLLRLEAEQELSA